MHAIFNVLLKLVLLVAGLVFAASLLVVALLLMLVWGLRALWARLTGQPQAPFVMRVDPRDGFGQVFRGRRPPAAADEPAAPRTRLRGRAQDIEDVQAKPPRD